MSPDACPNGHLWTRPRTYLVRVQPCSCSPDVEEAHGHFVWVCQTHGCDAEVWDPPMGDETCGLRQGSLYG